uniref:Uncharacterized protein n=1 Tax=Aegilops tauschii TaxID=37682 RepID=R7WFS7_AEGTA
MGNCFKLQRASESWVDDDEWEVDVVEGTKAAAENEKTGRVEVKIRVTKRQVQELLQQAARDGKGKRATEKVLTDLINSGTEWRHWFLDRDSIRRCTDYRNAGSRDDFFGSSSSGNLLYISTYVFLVCD